METTNELSGGSNTKPVVVGIVCLILGALLGAGGYYLIAPAKKSAGTTATKTTASAVKNPQITDAFVATSIDKDGKAVNPSNTFNKTEKSVYVVGTLKDVPKGAKIEYVRYLNGKYLDSKIGTVDKDNLRYYSFVWTAKAGKEHSSGVYNVKLYVNGETSESVNYVIK